jgi:DNA-binding NarL/FixJ family response regulator
MVAQQARGLGGAEAPAQVLVVDDHRMLAESLLSALASGSDRFVLCGPISDIGEGLGHCGDREPDVVLFCLHGGNPLERLTAVRELIDTFPRIRVIVVSDTEDESEAIDVFEAGATGFITSIRPLNELVTLIERVLDGKPVILPDSFPSMLRTASLRRRRIEEVRRLMAALTPREREVLELMSAGQSDAEIASRLFISQRTVERHVHTLMRKLGAESRLKAVILRLRPGVLAIDSEQATAS